VVGKENKEGRGDLIIGKHGRHWVDSPREGLSQDQDIGPDALMVAAQHFPGAAKPGLNLIRDQKRVVFLQQLLCSRQVPGIGNHHPSLSLNTSRKVGSLSMGGWGYWYSRSL
jgi:hypothetical protein